MEWQSIVLGPFSMAAGVLALLVVLAVFLWVTGKVEGYDPINEMPETRQRRPGYPLRAFYHGRGLCFARDFRPRPRRRRGAGLFARTHC